MLAAILSILLNEHELKDDLFFSEIISATPAEIDELLGEPETIRYLAIAPTGGFSIHQLATTLEREKWPMEFPGYQVRHTRFPRTEYKGVRIHSTTWHGNELIGFYLQLASEVESVLDLPVEDLERLNLPLPTSPPISGYDPPRIGGSNTTFFYRFAFNSPHDPNDKWHALYTLEYGTAMDSRTEGEPYGVRFTICISRLGWQCDLEAPNFGDYEPYKFIPRLVSARLPSGYTIPMSRPVEISVIFDEHTTFQQAAAFVGLSARDYAITRQDTNYLTAKPTVEPLSSAEFQHSYFWGSNDDRIDTVLAYVYNWGKSSFRIWELSLRAVSED